MAIQIGQQGWSQQTPAARQIIQSGMGAMRAAKSRRRAKRSGGATSKKPKKRAASSTRSSKKKGRSISARMIKGSAAAKRYMAKLRNMRKG